MSLLVCLGEPIRSDARKPDSKLIAAFDKSAKGMPLRYGPPDYAYDQILRPSPDGRYVARLVTSDGEVGYLTVYPNQPGRQHFLKHDAVSRQFADTNGCVWVPGHGHWLIVSTGGADYGEGMIALWTGSKHTRMLRRAKSSDGEGFNVRGVTVDGHTLIYALIYEHFGENSPDPDYKRQGHLRMLLPR